jgi:hypothetical protein
MNARFELGIEHRGGHHHLVFEAGELGNRIRDWNDGPLGAHGYTGPAIHAQLLGDDRFAVSYPNGLGRTVTHASHVTTTLFQNYFMSMIILCQFIFCSPVKDK